MANNIELLKQYKELLDAGIITSEEFESKRNEIISNIKDSLSGEATDDQAAESTEEKAPAKIMASQSTTVSVNDSGQKPKNFFIAAVVMELVSIVLMFMPKVYLYEKWGDYGDYSDNPFARPLEYRSEVNFFQGLEGGIGIVILVLLIVSIVLQLMIISGKLDASKSSVIAKYGGVFIAFPTILTLLFTFMGRQKDQYGYCIDFDWMFYIIIILLILATVASVYTAFATKKK